MRSGKEMYDYIIGMLADNNIKEIYIIDDGMLRTINKSNRRKSVGLLSASEVLAFVEYFMYVIRTYNPAIVGFTDEFSIHCKVNVIGNWKKICFSADVSDEIVFPQFNIRVKD